LPRMPATKVVTGCSLADVCTSEREQENEEEKSIERLNSKRTKKTD